MTTAPVNDPHWTADPQVIGRDVDTALRIADRFVSRIPGGWARLINRDVLELDPAGSLGTAVLLACQGARVSVAASQPYNWNAPYHDAFYQALFAHLNQRF